MSEHSSRMPALVVEDLTFRYLHGSAPALESANLVIEEGTVTGIVGANGTGKSTLCYALAGFIPHFFRGEMRGSVKVFGADTRQTTLGELITRIGLVFQNPFSQISGCRLTVSEEIAFGLENLGIAPDEIGHRVQRALERFDLTTLAARSPYNLSGGQQQRVALACILVMKPSVLVLDEPTSQLDLEGTRLVMETISELVSEGQTIILVEHKLEWIARLASRVVVLDRGRIVADGDPQAVLENAEEWGLVETRYAQAARLARRENLSSSSRFLPQTLEQAVDFFQKVD